MNTSAREHGIVPRRPGVALSLSLLMPGLGHLYCGELRLGVAIWLTALAAAVALPLAWARWLFVPLLPAAVLVAAWIALQVVLARDLLRRVRRDGQAYRLRPFNHPLTYLAFGLGLGVLPLYATWEVVTGAYVGSLDVADDAMFPQLLPGDRVVFDRAAFRGHAPAPGDLVVVAWPPGGPQVTRVIAAPGHTVHLREGRPVVDGEAVSRTPLEDLRVARFGEGPDAQKLSTLDGYEEQLGARHYVVTYDRLAEGADDPPPVTLGPTEIYVLGDNRYEALASHRYGRVPMEAVVGGPRYVWASVDPGGGVREGRIGCNVR
jgi:signal peptidase I